MRLSLISRCHSLSRRIRIERLHLVDQLARLTTWRVTKGSTFQNKSSSKCVSRDKYLRLDRAIPALICYSVVCWLLEILCCGCRLTSSQAVTSLVCDSVGLDYSTNCVKAKCLLRVRQWHRLFETRSYVDLKICRWALCPKIISIQAYKSKFQLLAKVGFYFVFVSHARLSSLVPVPHSLLHVKLKRKVAVIKRSNYCHQM